MSAARQKKTAKPAAEIISANPTRRSRAERSLVQLTTTSYPFYLIGNIVHVIYGGDESAAKSALAAENSLGLLDFIRMLDLKASNDQVVFDIHTVKIDPANVKLDAQLADSQLTPLASFTSEDERSVKNLAVFSSDLAKSLVEIYHRNQTRGMTRRFDISQPYWKLVERQIGLDQGKTQLHQLKRTENVQAIDVEQALTLVQEALSSGSFRLKLGAEEIEITVGDTTRSIVYEVPARS